MERQNQPESRGKVLRKLFFSTLYLSAFTFGGGYVIVTLMKKKFVDSLHWIDEDEMLDLTAIAQSAPGAIAVNGAIVVGYKLAGLIGALVASIATILPPFVIISLISVFYAAFRENFVIAAAAGRDAGGGWGGHRRRRRVQMGSGIVTREGPGLGRHHGAGLYRRPASSRSTWCW